MTGLKTKKFGPGFEPALDANVQLLRQVVALDVKPELAVELPGEDSTAPEKLSRRGSFWCCDYFTTETFLKVQTANHTNGGQRMQLWIVLIVWR